MTDPRKADLRETDQQKTGTKKGRIFKAAGFCVLLFLLFLVSCWLFQPKWDNYYNYDTPRSFYQEPSDTIETLFLGTSTVTNGISPIELYKEYGLCAFVLGTPEQPLLASYFWLKEACRLHPNSLKNVVLETSQFGKKPKEVAYHWGIDYMPLSPLKAEAVKAYSDGSLSGLITGLCPVIMYHRRWKELDRTDSDKWNYKVRSYSRGHNFEIKGRYLGYRDCFIPPYYPALEDTEEAVLSRESLYYFRKIKELCDEKGLNLILMRAATSNWRADRHKAVEALAERSGIPYIDFNCSPIIDSIGFSFARDMKDGNHVNCYGMKKMTSWMGKYLTETCGAEDIRGQERYAFMEAEREEYDRIAGGLLALDSELDPAGYISRAKDLNYTVFLSVKDDAASDMTKEQREAFREMGLVGLSDLEFRSSYLAVIENGKVTYEASEASPSGRAEEIKTANIPEKITENDVSMERAERDGETGHSPLNYKGNLRNGIGYSLTSGGFFLGNTASCLINGKEESLKGRGLNVVVYDSSYGTIADKACFDLFRSSLRSSFHPWEGAENEETLHLYDRICDDARRISVLRGRQEKEGVLGYLEEYAGREDYAVFITVKDDASAKLTDEVRAAFEAYGLEKLSTIGKRDSYYAMVRDGDRITERLDHGGEPVRRSGAISCGSAGALSYELVSGGFDSGNVSSIVINGTEYSPNSRGINIVIWDLMSNTEVVSTAFDSYADRMSLPEREGDDRSAQKAERGSR